MDFIFGTFATDELKVVHHRTARRGVQHNYEMLPRDPQPGDPVTLMVRLGTDQSAEAVACYYTLDGSPPQGSRGVATNGQVIHLQPRRHHLGRGGVGLRHTLARRDPRPAGRRGRALPDRRVVSTAARKCSRTGRTCRIPPNRPRRLSFAANRCPETPPGDPTRGQTFSYHVDQLARRTGRGRR